VREALADPIRAIVKPFGKRSSACRLNCAGDIYERGVVLTGGVAFLRKLDEHLCTGKPGCRW
jgi:actin-like ATPase involved in cell morphogenesis